MMKFNAEVFNVCDKTAEDRHFKAVEHLILNQMFGRIMQRNGCSVPLPPPPISPSAAPLARPAAESLEPRYGLAPILISEKREKFLFFIRGRGKRVLRRAVY